MSRAVGSQDVGQLALCQGWLLLLAGALAFVRDSSAQRDERLTAGEE